MALHLVKVSNPGRFAYLSSSCLLSFFLLENAGSTPHLALLRRRAVAQLGSALEWGSRGRGFESRRPDHVSVKMLNLSRLYNRKCAVLERCW